MESQTPLKQKFSDSREFLDERLVRLRKREAYRRGRRREA